VRRLLVSPAALVLAAVTACSTTAGTAVVASSPGTVGLGTQRLMLGLLDEEGHPAGGPDVPVTVELRRDGETVSEVPAEWVWTIEGSRGFSVATVELDRAGPWEVVLHPEGRPPTPPAAFTVVEDVSVPEVGEPAPPSRTPTHPDRPLAEITTDPDPEPAFYGRSVAEAVTSGRTSVIVFASPAFCQTATCGPVVDELQALAPGYPDVAFVHVEVYENLGESDTLTPVAAVGEWGLPSEPWVFVVGPDGRIRARFEGTVSPRELAAALS